MLELRPTCENCNKLLPVTSTEAMICTFECTFCKDCVANVLQNVCPNCGGGFTPRPIRPKAYGDKYSPTEIITHRPVDLNKFEKGYLETNKDILPEER